MTSYSYSDLNQRFGYPGQSELVLDQAAIRQALYNIFTTTPGEAGPIFEPEFGSLLPQLVHEPMDRITEMRLEAATLQAIQRWEPRIEVDIGQSSIVANYQYQLYDVRIVYRIRHSGESGIANLKLRRTQEVEFRPFTLLEKIISLRELGWPGTYEFCRVRPNGDLGFSGDLSWGQLTVWTEFTTWGTGATNFFRYTTIIDSGYDTQRKITPVFESGSEDILEILVSTSSDGLVYNDPAPFDQNSIYTPRFLKFEFKLSSINPVFLTADLYFYI
jgi:phage baseplate assembly protein W